MDRRRSALLLALMLCFVGAASAVGATAAAALTFTPPVHYDVGGKPADIAAADVNGDGHLDLVTSAENGLSVLLWAGQGRFAPAIHLVLEHRPGAIAAGDINGDGVVDVVTACSADDTVTVLLGDGTGAFVAKGTFPTGKAPSDVVVGDLTGDRLADVATADMEGDGISILKGDGAGNLSAPLDLPVGNTCASLLGADFNDDGTMDLAYTRYEWEEYAGFGILLADGSGGFTPMGTYETGGEDALPGALALGDVNRDDKPDIAVLQGNQGDGRIFTFLGDGLGVFVPASETLFNRSISVSGLAVADLNGDFCDDAVTSGYRPGYTTGSSGTSVTVPEGPPRIWVMLSHGTAGVYFTPTSFLAGRVPGEVLLDDFNGDHQPDLATTDVRATSVSVRMNGSLPVLAGVSPAQGRAGSVVTLTGKRFLKRGGTVEFGGKTATSVLNWSTTAIRVRVPAGTPKGRVSVTVTTIMGRSTARYFTRL